ncbi:MAG: helix-turn-helix domain-containing protein [Micropruina sp.]|nr:helix-turn-helix transcriptional regulator [Micropruina sp.]
MRSYGQYCALARGLDLVGDRWTLLIVRELLTLGPCRYSDLLRGLPGIATNLLADRLNSMEASGLVERRELVRPASGTVIALTPRGSALQGVVREFLKWGAPAMMAPTPEEAFQAHWLALPLRALCRDNKPSAGRQVVRIGDVADGCDIEADAGSITVSPSRATVTPDAVVSGAPDAIVALFTGRRTVAELAPHLNVAGSVEAVGRVIGGMPAGVPSR